MSKVSGWAKNKYLQGAGRYVAAASALTLVYLGFEQVRKKVAGRHMSFVHTKLKEHIPEPLYATIEQDKDYVDICHRLLDFRGLAPECYKEFVEAVAQLVKYTSSVPETPTQAHVKEYSVYAHKVINAVRRFRAYLELKLPSILDDFDEVAQDIQTKYDEDHERFLFDSQLRW